MEIATPPLTPTMNAAEKEGADHAKMGNCSTDGTTIVRPQMPPPIFPIPSAAAANNGSNSINCLLLGDGCADIANLLRAYIHQCCPGQAAPTHFYGHPLQTTVCGVPVVLKLWLLSGRECFDKLRMLAYKQVPFDVFLVCFSVVEPASFASVETRWVPEMKWNCPSKRRPFLLVGTQIELRTDMKTYEKLAADGRMPITAWKAEKLARKLKAHKYMECSAERRQGVQELFDASVLAALRHQRTTQSAIGTGCGNKQRKGGTMR